MFQWCGVHMVVLHVMISQGPEVGAARDAYYVSDDEKSYGRLLTCRFNVTFFNYLVVM